MDELRDLELRVTPLEIVGIDQLGPCGDPASVFARGTRQELELAQGGVCLALELAPGSTWPLAPCGEFRVQGLPAEWRVYRGEVWQRPQDEEGPAVTLRPCMPMG